METAGKKRNKLVYLLVALALVIGGGFAAGAAYADDIRLMLESRKIKSKLDLRAKAISGGDAAAFIAFFRADYSDPWLTMDAAKPALLARYQHTPYPVISYGKKKIEIQGDRAVVAEEFSLEDRVQGRTRTYREIQHLLMEKRGEDWSCIGGSKVLSLLAGRMEAEYDIEQVMLRRENALVKEDLRAYMTLILPEYNHKDKTFEKIKEDMAHTFSVFDQIDYKSFDRIIRFLGDEAIVEQRFNMHALLMGEPKTFSDKEIFVLVRTEEGWKFAKGL